MSPRLKRIGWILLIVGLVWDVAYHGTLVVVGGALGPLFDVIGNLGHVVTFAGIVIVILYLLRENQNQPPP